MMLEALFITLLTVSTARSEECRPTVSDLVTIGKREVDLYDKFVYGRYLKTEQDICDRALEGVEQLNVSFPSELEVVLSGVDRQLEIIQSAAKATEADGCISQIIENMKNTRIKEEEKFQKCLEVPLAQLVGMGKDINEDLNKYQDMKERAISAVESCTENLPPGCPDDMPPCMKTQLAFFQTQAQGLTDSRANHSLCMSKFTEVLECFVSSAARVLAKVNDTRRYVSGCTFMINEDSIRQSIYAFVDLIPSTSLTGNSSLLAQVRSAQGKYQETNSHVMDTLGKYYQLEKSAKMTYKFRPHKEEEFRKRLEEEFAALGRAVEAVRRDKQYSWPAGRADVCCDQALEKIKNLLDNGASSCMYNEACILKNTEALIARVEEELMKLSDNLAGTGDTLLLECFKRGLVLTPKTIADCHDLNLQTFNLTQRQYLQTVRDRMTLLTKYNDTYFSLPGSLQALCGDRLDQLKIQGDRILYKLNRCPFEPVDNDTPSYTLYTLGYDKKSEIVPDDATEGKISYFYHNLFPRE